MKTQNFSSPVLVIGGTGKIGRRVAEQLKARDIAVKIGARSATPSFDWEDRGTWSAALDDVAAAYISYYPDLAVPGAAEQIAAFAELAVKKGVRRLVLLSGRGEEGAERAEEALKHSDADWTIVRAAWFFQNFSESFLVEPLLAGEVALPVGRVNEPFIDADDVAAVAVAALTEDGHVGQLYEVTGPRLMRFADAISEISNAADREIAFHEISIDDFEAALRADGLDDGFIALLKELFEVVLDGRNAHLTDGVERALGRPPRDFADYARETAASGVWYADPALSKQG
jgi:uncharacterized protein YbjT (DUF2867 family)